MCFKVVLLVSVLCAAIQTTVGRERAKKFGRIYGSAAVFGEHLSWVAAIGKSGQFLCGGSVINKRTVLTTAECIHEEPIKRLSVRVGSLYKSRGGQMIPVAEAIFPEAYEKNKWSSNIAILRLSYDIDPSLNVQPIALARDGQYTQVGTGAEVCGWGETTHGMPEYLHCARVELMSHDICRKWYSELLMNDHIICAHFVSPSSSECYRDSGGPLVVNETLVGVISWDWLDQCTRMYEPGVYTKVSAFIDWINNYLRMHGDKMQ